MGKIYKRACAVNQNTSVTGIRLTATGNIVINVGENKKKSVGNANWAPIMLHIFLVEGWELELLLPMHCFLSHKNIKKQCLGHKTLLLDGGCVTS